MRLRVRDAAEFLNVSEKTIYRWIGQNKIPVHRLNEQYRFNRLELLEWAASQHIRVSPEMAAEPESNCPVSIESALRAGGIYYRVEGTDKASVLRSVVNVVPLSEDVDREFLLQMLLARESLGSTAIGNGIAIPHVRNPIMLHLVSPLVILCFLENPIDFQAIDGKPVSALFTIISPTIQAHLSLLSRLSFGLRSSEFANAVARVTLREEILQAAAALDEQIDRAARSSLGDAQ